MTIFKIAILSLVLSSCGVMSRVVEKEAALMIEASEGVNAGAQKGFKELEIAAKELEEQIEIVNALIFYFDLYEALISGEDTKAQVSPLRENGNYFKKMSKEQACFIQSFVDSDLLDKVDCE